MSRTGEIVAKSALGLLGLGGGVLALHGLYDATTVPTLTIENGSIDTVYREGMIAYGEIVIGIGIAGTAGAVSIRNARQNVAETQALDSTAFHADESQSPQTLL